MGKGEVQEKSIKSIEVVSIKDLKAEFTGDNIDVSKVPSGLNLDKIIYMLSSKRMALESLMDTEGKAARAAHKQNIQRAEHKSTQQSDSTGKSGVSKLFNMFKRK